MAAWPYPTLRQFSQLRQEDHFISPEGDWCVKKSVSKATCMDSSSERQVGETIRFFGSEIVEPLPPPGGRYAQI